MEVCIAFEEEQFSTVIASSSKRHNERRTIPQLEMMLITCRWLTRWHGTPSFAR